MLIYWYLEMHNLKRKPSNKLCTMAKTNCLFKFSFAELESATKHYLDAALMLCSVGRLADRLKAVAHAPVPPNTIKIVEQMGYR